MSCAAEAKVRAFVAICLHPDLIDRIRREQDRLRTKLPGDAVRWTRVEQLHLTLKFLGNVPAAQLEALQLSLNHASQGLGPFQMTVEGLGGFPTPRLPSIIWLGLTGELDALLKLQSRVEDGCASFGSHAEERPFHPHLTIGRVKAVGADLRQIGEILTVLPVGVLGSSRIEEITLMQSRLSPQGSSYIPLGRFKLQSRSVPR
jgi:2'-5' RNA ligase